MMNKTLKVGQWSLEIDYKKTREYYSRESNDACNCVYCENFRINVDTLSESLLGFFDLFGIDPRKGEFTEYGNLKDNLIMYQGCYPLVGSIKDGSRTILNDWTQDELIEIENFKFGFSDEHLTPIPRDFPEPIVELHLETYFPWKHKGTYQ